MNGISRIVFGVMAVLCCASTARAQASPPVKSDQDILIELEHNWDAAFHRHDQAFIDRILADEFIVTYDNGVRGDRALELKLALIDENIDSSEMDEFIVKEFGNTAVVWFTLHLVGPATGG